MRNAARPKTLSSEQTKLNIGKELSEFFSSFRVKVDSRIAVMEKKRASFDEYQKEKSKIPDGDIRIKIYKNYPKKGELTFTDKIFTTNYRYTESLEKPQWKIESETKEILGYKCQKATTSFRGRIWTAWYASDIPVQDGPWKLWGLPGLILEANDSDSLYNFAAIGMEQKEETSIAVIRRQYVDCSYDEYRKRKDESGRDLIGIASRETGMTIRNDKGEVVRPREVKFADIEK